MKYNILSLLIITGILIGSGCKKKASDSSNDDQNQTPDEAVFEAFNLLNDTYDMFYEKAATVPDSPKEAIMLTDEWLNTQDMVEETEVFDSAYINIFTKAGVETTFNLIPVNADSTPIYRGSGGFSGGKLTSYINRENPCANVIQNKKVLIFAAAFLPKQKILDYFDKSDIGFDVTVKKIKECDPGLVDTFKDYGLVILDTHGDADAFLTGLKIEFKEKPADLETFKAEIIKQAGTANYERFLNGYLKFSHGIRYNPFEQHYWEKPILPIFSSETVWITAKYISTLTGLSNTIIFGNMCYSGYQHPPHPSEKLFIGQAFKNVKPISYYCYAFNTENSFPVADHFARQMEDSLVR